ncbi:unnamed protein product [Owenia fusiformis]|uniref:Uncharacterized protein n=1 Tax=Owenia fusiformis TaxID=6347 RepID=A0A8J1Y6U7_OWEFU|nr:unnamed protein product [Owenia fusiformis]
MTTMIAYTEEAQTIHPDNLNLNGTLNGTCWTFPNSIHLATLLTSTIIVVVVIVLGCFGNGLVLLSAAQCRSPRVNIDILIINLAGTDFLMCTFFVSIYLYLLFAAPDNPAVFCHAIQFLVCTCALLSLTTQVIIAMHRFTRVVWHTKGTLSLLKAGLILAGLWLFSLGVSIGGVLHVSGSWDSHWEDCLAMINSCNRKKNNFVLFYLGPVCLVSFTLIIIAYSVIAHAVRKQSNLKHSPTISRTATPRQSPYKVPAGVPEDNARPSSAFLQQLSFQKVFKALSTCLVVTLSVLICWGPLIVTQFIEYFTGESLVLFQVKISGIGLIFLSSALNPYIYAQNSTTLKQKIVSLHRTLVVECRRCSRCKKTKLKPMNPSVLDGEHDVINRIKSSHAETQHTLHIGSPHAKRKVDRSAGPSQTHRIRSGTNTGIQTRAHALVHAEQTSCMATHTPPIGSPISSTVVLCKHEPLPIANTADC